jgi:hypothetical protein
MAGGGVTGVPGGNLPSPGELRGFGHVDGITLASPEWTDELTTRPDPTELEFVYLRVSESFEDVAPFSTFTGYRCVAGPVLR